MGVSRYDVDLRTGAITRLYDPLDDHADSEDEGTVYREEEPYRDRDPRESWESAWRESRDLHR